MISKKNQNLLKKLFYEHSGAFIELRIDSEIINRDKQYEYIRDIQRQFRDLVNNLGYKKSDKKN